MCSKIQESFQCTLLGEFCAALNIYVVHFRCRYCQPPAKLWEWMEPYLEDEEVGGLIKENIFFPKFALDKMCKTKTTRQWLSFQCPQSVDTS